jgi:hypothetical protein
MYSFSVSLPSSFAQYASTKQRVVMDLKEYCSLNSDQKGARKFRLRSLQVMFDALDDTEVATIAVFIAGARRSPTP